MIMRRVNTKRLRLNVLCFVAIPILLVQLIGAPLYASANDQLEKEAHINSGAESIPFGADSYDDEPADRTSEHEGEGFKEVAGEAEKDLEKPAVSVERNGEYDHVSVEHEDDLFDYLSFDNLLALKREGTGDIEKVEKIEADGQVLEEPDYYIKNVGDAQQIIIDGNKLHANPPKKIQFMIKSSGVAKYGMALKDDLPNRALLNEDGTFLEANFSDGDLGSRSAGQCEPNGNINSYAKSVDLHKPIYNHSQFGNDELFVTLKGLTPGETINEIVFLQNSNFHISDGARAILFEDEEGRLTKANDARDNQRSISNIIVREKGPNDADQSLILEFPPVKIGQTGEINVVIPSRNRVGYRLRAQVTKILDFGAYAAPYQEADLATALPRRKLSTNEQYGGTKVYISENTDKAQIGQTRTSLRIKGKGEKGANEIGASQWSYNGLAFDERDNWLYAVSNKRQGENANCYPAGHLLQINPVDGKVRNLGALRGLEGGDILSNAVDENGRQAHDRLQINSGSFYDGYLYVSSSTETGSKKIYRITPPSQGGFKHGEPVVERTLYQAYSSDYVQLPGQNQYLWGMIGSEAKKRVPNWHKLSTLNTHKMIVERIDLRTGSTDYFEIPEEKAKTISGKKPANPKEWGKAWSYGNGNLGFGAEGIDSRDATALRLEVKNGGSSKPEFKVLEVMSGFSQAENSDSSSNSTRSGFLKSDLVVNKKQLVGHLNSIDQEHVDVLKRQGANTSGYYYWLIDVKNLGAGASSGSLIHELLPDVFDLTSIRFTAKGLNRNLSNASVPVMLNGTYPPSNGKAIGLVFSVGEISGQSSLRVYLAAKLKPGKECIPNTVSIVNDDADSNGLNHHSTADCVIEETKVDFNAEMTLLGTSENALPKYLTGGIFEVFEGKEGVYEFQNVDGRAWKSKINENGTTGKYTSSEKLTVGKYYWLVEKKPPHEKNSTRNAAPLGGPLLFRLVQDRNRNVKVEFYNQTTPHKCIAADGWGSCSDIARSLTDRMTSDSVSIQVDRSPVAVQPELPKTGGRGLIGVVVLGFLVLVSGIGLIRRRSLLLD